MTDWTSASKKAARTGKWATTMTKWLTTYATVGPTWQLVSFNGPRGGEAVGIVDVLAVRKNHRRPRDGVKRGDLLELILLQIKGGAARWPTAADVDRLRRVARYHRASAVVLASWQKGRAPTLFRLRARWGAQTPARERWRQVDASEVFG